MGTAKRIRPMVKRLCAWCGEPFDASLAEAKRGNARYCSLSCVANDQHSKRPAGKCKSSLMQHARNAAVTYGMLSCNTKCEECGRTVGTGIDIHHNDYDRKNNAPNNLRTLCRSCHITLHNRIRGMERRTIASSTA